MIINDKKKHQAEYERFIDLMARMCLKYGANYKLITITEIMELFPEHQCGRE